MNDKNQDNYVKSGTEFLAIFGFVLIGIGVLGAIGIIASFDWDTYSEASSYSSTLEDDILQPDIALMWSKAGASLLGAGSIGLFFIAVDRIALILKKIQLGISYDTQLKENKVEADKNEGYGSL